MDQPLVSILIPVYNRVNLVGETIESALAQSYANTEIIICDNQSTDGTWELLQDYAARYDKVKIFRNAENVGPVGNWKRCVQQAGGKYSKILFSDDLISENFISATVPIMQDDIAFALGAVQPLAADINSIQSPIADHFKKVESTTYLKDVLLQNKSAYPVSPGAALFRTRDLLKNILVNIENKENLDFSRYGAGNDLWVYLLTALEYRTIAVVPSAIAYFRIHDDSFTISNDLSLYYNYSKSLFANKYFPEVSNTVYTYFFLKYLRRKKRIPFETGNSRFNFKRGVELLLN